MGIMRAFQIAKDYKQSNREEIGDDYIELKEFKFFLIALRQYFEYWVAFTRLDDDGDKRISLVEFTHNKESIEKWVGPINDIEACFKEIDLNGGGIVLFDEFSDWAIKKSLDLDDDVEQEGADFEGMLEQKDEPREKSAMKGSTSSNPEEKSAKNSLQDSTSSNSEEKTASQSSLLPDINWQE